MTKHFGLVLGIIGLALAIRLAYIHTTSVDGMRGDAVSYVAYAYNLFNYHTFSKQRGNVEPQPDSFWAPGFPLFLAVTMALSDKWQEFYPIALLSHVILGILLIPFAFLLGDTFLSRSATVIVALLITFSPHLVSMGSYLLTETLFAAFQFSAVAIFYLALKEDRLGLFVLSGALFGYSYLVNPVIFFIPWLFGLLLLLQIKRDGQSLLQGAFISKLLIFLLVFSVFWGGWAVRNALNVPDEAASVSHRALSNLIIGAHPEFFDNWRAEYIDPTRPSIDDDYATAGGSFIGFAAILFDRIIEQPAYYLQWYLLQKPYLLWSWNILVGQGDIYVYPVEYSLYTDYPLANMTRELMKLLHPVILVCTLLGLYPLIKGLHSKQLTWLSPPVLLYTVLVYITLLYVTLQAEPRYSIPFRPELYLCALWSLQYYVNLLWRRLEPTKSSLS